MKKHDSDESYIKIADHASLVLSTAHSKPEDEFLKLPSKHSVIDERNESINSDGSCRKLTDETKKTTFIACLLALTICSMMIENMAAFMPPYIENHPWVSDDNYLLTSFDASLILSIFSIAQIMFAPCNSIIKNRMGSKNIIMVGFLLLTLTTFGLGAIAVTDDPYLFKNVSLVLRFL